MSIGFNWFKAYEITPPGSRWLDYELHYIGGGSTSHSAGNVIKVQNLLEKYGKVEIPRVSRHWIDSMDYDLGLIDPDVMYDACEMVLYTAEVDEVGMRERFEWLRQLSDDGYYLTYDIE